jgi:glycosyltransferase involved in cell wall biosynthesis
MAEPLVSISCITYNHAPFIRECLDGFLMQKTNFEFEIIIHDDASTDGTKEIILEYASKYPQIIFPHLQTENQYSKGVTIIAPNFNYPRCNGKYIAFCEGDDYWIDERKLQKQIDFLESNPEFTMCFHSSRVIQQVKDVKKDFPPIEDREYQTDELFLKWLIPSASIVFRKNVLDERIKSKKLVGGDRVLSLLCADKGKIMGISDVMSAYRIHSGGISFVRIRDLKVNLYIKYIDHFKYLGENFNKISPKLISLKIVDNCMTIFLYYAKKGNPKAIKYLFLAIYYRPELLWKGLLKPFKRI